MLRLPLKPDMGTVGKTIMSRRLQKSLCVHDNLRNGSQKFAMHACTQSSPLPISREREAAPRMRIQHVNVQKLLGPKLGRKSLQFSSSSRFCSVGDHSCLNCSSSCGGLVSPCFAQCGMPGLCATYPPACLHWPRKPGCNRGHFVL